MFKKILLAYDGSTAGAVALRQGADLARLSNAELHLLGVVVTTGFSALAEGFGADVWGMVRNRLQPDLDAIVHELQAQGINALYAIREGDPAAEIIAYVRTTAPDLIIVGHRGKGVIARWFEGSVGIGLLNNLPCSLLIVSGKGEAVPYPSVR